MSHRAIPSSLLWFAAFATVSAATVVGCDDEDETDEPLPTCSLCQAGGAAPGGEGPGGSTAGGEGPGGGALGGASLGGEGPGGGSVGGEGPGGGPVGGQGGGAPQYECKIAEDTPSESSCVQTGVTCNLLTVCDANYSCSGNSCACDDPRQCGIICTDDSDCPTLEWAGRMACHPTEQVCVFPLPCLGDGECGAGNVCAPVLLSAYLPLGCVLPGGGDAGAACTDGGDCASGICSTGVCLDKCITNADCPLAAPYCSSVPNGGLFGTSACVAVPFCGGACTADQACHDFLGCYEGCASSADCSAGVCVHEGRLEDVDGQVAGFVDSVMPGHCVDTAAACDSDEYLLWHEYYGATGCFAQQRCWYPEDCSDPYECIEVEGAAFCGRLL